jgi:hypothetical protein
MTTALPKIECKKTKSNKPPKTKAFTEENIEELISKANGGELELLYSEEELLKIKQKLLIHRIKQLRNNSALKIQTMWSRYLTRLKVHKTAHHVQGCYTISPNIKNVTKVSIKIFTNELNKDEFTILPLRFCQIRKSFVIDIPKNKFYTKKKLLRFNFIYKNNIFFDDNYEQVLYFNEMVHEVDFSLYDKKQKILEETVYNLSELSKKALFSSHSSSKDSNCLSTEDEKENSENLALTPDKFTRKFSFSESKEDNDDEDEYSGLRAIKRKGTELEKEKVITRYKKYESFDITYSSKSKLKSILKCPNIEFNKRRVKRESNKKVSFGETIYIY